MLESSGISIGHARSIATKSEGAGVLIPLISDDSPTKNQSLALWSESTWGGNVWEDEKRV